MKTPFVEELLPGPYYAFVEARRRWSAWRANVVSPDDALAHEGQRVKVRGVVEPVEVAIAAEFSGAAAVFFEVVEKERARLVGGKEDIHEVHRRASTSPFFIVGEDGTKVLVEPTIAIHTLKRETLPSAEDAIRTEARLAPGARVEVFGLVDSVGAVARTGYRVEATKMARLAGTIAEPIVISAAPDPK